MTSALLIFPHQLFENHPGLIETRKQIVFIEDSLFFGDPVYPVSFHKQKLWFHRATMQRLSQQWTERGLSVTYVHYRSNENQIGEIIGDLKSDGIAKIVAVDPTDFILERRLRHAVCENGLELEFLPSPLFINNREENADYRSGKKRWFMADFYKWQRERLDILMKENQPIGGQWSFDADNRKKVPKSELSSIPRLSRVHHDDLDKDAQEWVKEHFPNAPGELDHLYFPTSHEGASAWLDHFVASRLETFGPYEDAIVRGEKWLWHSVLTPMLNVGLLTPHQIVDRVTEMACEKDIPLNSLEGFIRQVIGWREFMRATYEDLGVKMRTTNQWEHTNPLPDGLWTAETGIDPIDDTIGRILQTGYCHHIERLMVLGGFLFLCEVDPKEIYCWFMALFIDAYDWVMVPNVYAMSQNADGGSIITKPYFSGSAYIRKVSHWKQGKWSEIWDGLYWRWIWHHREALGANPRWAMMVATAKKMDAKKREAHISVAENYLAENVKRKS